MGLLETASPDNRTVLVTGGGGFLGKAIVREMILRGERVRSFSRSFHPELERLGAEQVLGNIADEKAVEKACKGAGVIFHTAAKAGVWGPYKDYYQTNVTGTRNVIAACRSQGTAALIHTSSPSVIFDGRDMEGVNETVPYPAAFHAHYPKTKALAEQEVRQAAADGLKTVILRPHLIWGPEDNHLVPRILARAGKLRIVGECGKKVDTIYIDNAAHAHLLAAEKLLANPRLSGRVYFISQDDPIPLWDMVNAILKAGGLPRVTRRISAKTAYAAGALLEMLYTLLRMKSEPQMTRFLAKELATSHWFDISAAKSDLGYRPLISTEEGLLRLEEWLKNN
ncbi:MAG: NAD-dependent epimerase/dehydratase family protein [Desulfococcaceae bacterium]